MVRDPLAAKYPALSPYAYSGNNPLNYLDPDGRFALSIHYKITYDILSSFGYNKAAADWVAHYASVFADNPPDRALKWNNLLLKPSMSFRAGINYSATINSQMEGDPISNPAQQYNYNIWHAMRSDYEAENNLISDQGAMARGLEFGWSKIFESASYGSISSLGSNTPGMKALGQGLHALQDAFAHRGASWKEHSKINDARWPKGNAQKITASVIAVHQILNGDFSSIKNGQITIAVEGMSQKQLEQLWNKLHEYLRK